MESFIENAKNFKQGRDIYMAKYNGIKELKKQKLQKAKELQKNKVYSENPLTFEELNLFGENIDKEYSMIPKEEIDNWSSSGGIPGGFCWMDYGKYFDDIENHKKHEKHKNHKNEEHYSEKRGKKLSEKHSLNESSYNCKQQYYDCVEKIKSFNIDIYGVNKVLKNYKNRTVSSCCGGTDSFYFYCRKNIYRFEIVFSDDCDCYPGLLYVKSIEDFTTKVIIPVNCDLYCQNTGPHELENFLNLIDCISLEEYFHKRFGHYLRLSELFEKNGFVVISQPNLPTATINKHDFNFNCEINNGKGSCLVIPYRKDYEGSEYCLYICPTLTQINEKNKTKSYYYKKEKIDVNTFNHDMREISYKISYESDDDFPELVKCVNAYIDKMSGNYGFYDMDEQVWKNDKNIQQYVNTIKKFKLSTFVNNYTGPDFDVFIKFNPGEYGLWSALTNDHLTDMEYMYDFYGVRFWYDKKVNPEKCFVTIQGKYYDLTRVANDYYKNEKKFNMETYDLGIKDISEKLTIEGTYDECFDKMKYFMDFLYKINYDEKPIKKNNTCPNENETIAANETIAVNEIITADDWASGW